MTSTGDSSASPTHKPRYSRLAEAAMALTCFAAVSVVAIPVIAKMILNDTRSPWILVWSVATLVLAPVAVLLGLVAIVRLRRQPSLLGRGKAWFAVVAGTLVTAFLLSVLLT